MRTIKSWVSRIGSLSALQKTMLTLHEGNLFFKVNDYLAFKEAVLKVQSEQIFLEIGFGDGQTLIQLAQQFPQVLILGFEPHLSGVAHCLVKIQELGLKNVILFQGDVLDFLEDRTMPLASRVHVYFSDPWPKTRHHKRRLIQSSFLALLAERLTVGSLLHFATDWQDYADHMLECFEQLEKFVLVSPQDIPAEQFFKRPRTKYEQRGLRLGHTITEFYAIHR
jgi:tRNA (guanine-N7-)-methyltransferase